MAAVRSPLVPSPADLSTIAGSRRSAVSVSFLISAVSMRLTSVQFVGDRGSAGSCRDCGAAKDQDIEQAFDLHAFSMRPAPTSAILIFGMTP